MLRGILSKPSTDGSVSDTTLMNMRWLLYDGLFAASSLAIINTFYTLYLEALGATNTQIGLMSSMTNLILLLTVLPGAWFSEKIGSQKKAVLITSGGISRFFLLVSVFLPYWFSGQTAVLPVIAARLMVDTFNILGVPPWTALAAGIVPMQHRGKFFATRNLIMNISTMVTTLAVGRLITVVGKPGGFQVAMAVAFVAGLAGTFVYMRIKEPPTDKSAVPQSYSPKSLLETLKTDTNLRNYSIFLFLWNSTISLAGPFFTIYLVRDLKATTDVVGVLAMITTLTGLPATYFFGKLIDRWGGWKAQVLTGFLIPIYPLLWLLADTPWGAAPAFLFDGIVWAGYNLASFTFMLTLASPSQLTLYNAIIQVMVALGATIGASLGGIMISAWGFKAVFAISGAGRLLAMLFFWRFVKPADKPAAEPELSPQPDS